MVGKVLILLTSHTPLDIVGDPAVHPWPREAVLCLPDGFVPAWVPGSGVVVDQDH